jgi:hypothetical protein
MVDSDAEWSPRLIVSEGGIGTMSLRLFIIVFDLVWCTADYQLWSLAFDYCVLVLRKFFYAPRIPLTV